MSLIETTHVSNMEEYISTVSAFVSSQNKDCVVYFRGEKKYPGCNAFVPSVFRDGLHKKEHIFYREITRFNDKYFEDDKSTIDRLCRMQHNLCATRLLDLSEDCFTALYFALLNDKTTESYERYVYSFAIPQEKIKYYDSDAVTILANLVKLPFDMNDGESLYGNKSKTCLVESACKIISGGMTVKEYNEKYLSFLLHHIREDKPQMSPLINLGDIFSVQCVKTKLNTDRIRLQKGAFLIFGLNVHEPNTAIPLDGSYAAPDFWRDSSECSWVGTPVKKILKIGIGKELTKKTLENLGISMQYIYPEMRDINDYLKGKFAAANVGT
jgi:hypothetical protein